MVDRMPHIACIPSDFMSINVYVITIKCSAADGNSSCHRLRRRFSKRSHFADVKSIAKDDQATLTVDQNSTNIKHTFRFYVCEIVTDAPQLTAASGDRSNST